MAWFSEKLNICFVHVPKTAGVSISSVLKKNIDDLQSVQQLRNTNGYPEERWNNNHTLGPNILKTFEKCHINYDNMLFFGVIRNPWNRMVSLYEHRKRNKRYNTKNDMKLLDKGFNKWLFNTTHFSDKILTKKPQIDWFESLPNTKIIKFENLSSNIIGDIINQNISLPKNNANKKKV